MAESKAFTAEQVAVLRRYGLQHHSWELCYETQFSLIIHNPTTGEYRLVHKK